MKITSVVVVGALVLASGNLWAASGRQDSIERLQMSSDTLHAMINATDKGIPEEVIADAKCMRLKNIRAIGKIAMAPSRIHPLLPYPAYWASNWYDTDDV
jgi:hypothetical protein